MGREGAGGGRDGRGCLALTEPRQSRQACRVHLRPPGSGAVLHLQEKPGFCPNLRKSSLFLLCASSGVTGGLQRVTVMGQGLWASWSHASLTR